MTRTVKVLVADLLRGDRFGWAGRVATVTDIAVIKYNPTHNKTVVTVDVPDIGERRLFYRSDEIASRVDVDTKEPK